MRHAEFKIGELERDSWLRNMKSAVDEIELESDLKKELWDYLVMAANSMINQPRSF